MKILDNYSIYDTEIINSIANNNEKLTYYYPIASVFTWQGIKYLGNDQYILSGTDTNNSGVYYIGPVNMKNKNNYYTLTYPESSTTSIYGPDLVNNVLRLVGSYKTSNSESGNFGFLFIQNAWQTITYNSYNKYTFVHSVMGSLCILNTDSRTKDIVSDTAQAFIYNIDNSSFTNISYPLSLTTTAYGLWWNGNSSYTIVGGYSKLNSVGIASIYEKDNKVFHPYGIGFIVDYDSSTQKFTNWTSVSVINSIPFLTHIQGITGYDTNENIYNVVAVGFANGTYYSQIITLQRSINGFTQTNSTVSNSPNIVLTSIANNVITGVNTVNIVQSSSGPTTFAANF